MVVCPNCGYNETTGGWVVSGSPATGWTVREMRGTNPTGREGGTYPTPREADQVAAQLNAHARGNGA